MIQQWQRLHLFVLLLSALALPIAAGQERPGDAAVPGAAVQSADDEAECRRELASLRELYQSIPTDFRGHSRADLEVLAARVNECRDRLEKFLDHCRLGKDACDAPFMYARLRTSLAARVRSDKLQKENMPPEQVSEYMKQYHREDVGHCDRALECAGDAPEWESLRCRARDLKADISFQLAEFTAALDNYGAVMKNCPDYKDLGASILGAGRSYIELHRAREGLVFIRKAIKEHYRDTNLPSFYEVLWNLLEVAGDIDGMIAWCDEVETIFPVRLMREGIPRFEADGYRRYLGFSGFRRGYALFAKGDLSGAVDAFVKHIEAMNALETDAQNNKGTFPQELRIYRQRSMDVLQIIQDKVGDAPECDLELEEMWVSPARLRLSESQGKAVLLLFRGYGDKRSQGIFKRLDEHLGRNPTNKAMVVVHYLKGSRDPYDQLEKVQDEVVELGIQHAAVGMDPDHERKETFRCLRAMVGSATLMIFDRQGRLMWWMQDPREMDAWLVIAIWERLAAE